MNRLPARDEFLGQLNTIFRVVLNAEQALDIELTEVTEIRRKNRFEAFALVFRAPLNYPLVQAMLRVEHESLGTMELFLVPFEVTEEALFLEALFNQKVTAAND